MAIKQKPVFVCDKCGNEMEKPCVTMEDVPHEGASEIIRGKKSFSVGGQHYCSLDCAIADIRDSLSANAQDQAPQGSGARAARKTL